MGSLPLRFSLKIKLGDALGGKSEQIRSKKLLYILVARMLEYLGYFTFEQMLNLLTIVGRHLPHFKLRISTHIAIILCFQVCCE